MSSVKTRSGVAITPQSQRRVTDAESVERYTYAMERKTALELCVDLNTPRSMAVWYLLSEDSPESIGQYLTLPPPIRRNCGLRRPLPLGVGNCERLAVVEHIKSLGTQMFADDYLVTEIMSKNPGLNSGIDRKAAAITKFHEAEASCASTNRRLLELQFDHGNPYWPLIRGMQRVISKVLGKLSSRKLSTAEANFSFGPGATSAVSGADVLLSRKYAGELHMTPRLYPYVSRLCGAIWRAFPGTDSLVNDESRTTNVPKNAKTDRVIAIEPHLNIFVQKGIGTLLRNQLRHNGVDLDTQEWNQFLARKAQDWSLATIDLSSASDMVSSRLVRLLLPREWFELLYLCRTDFTVVDGVRVALEKFSSMGNGYTFELETLIFYAATQAVGAHKALTAVYGDDIIVEKTIAPALVDLLDFIGFKTNAKKTFLEGNFFESCGTDWYNGQDVRPPFLKGDYVDRTQCHFYIPNALRRYASRRSLGYGCDIRFKKAWSSAYRRLTPLERRTAIPDGTGDEGLTRNWDESAPSRRWCNHLHAWQGRVLPLKAVRSNRTDQNGAYVAALHRGATLMPVSTENVRGRTRRSDKLRYRPTLGWADLGPWI